MSRPITPPPGFRLSDEAPTVQRKSSVCKELLTGRMDIVPADAKTLPLGHDLIGVIRKPLGNVVDYLLVPKTFCPNIVKRHPWPGQVPAERSACTHRKAMFDLVPLARRAWQGGFGDLGLIDCQEPIIAKPLKPLQEILAPTFHRYKGGRCRKGEDRIYGHQIGAFDIDLEVIGNPVILHDLGKWYARHRNLVIPFVPSFSPIEMERTPFAVLMVDEKVKCSRNLRNRNIEEFKLTFVQLRLKTGPRLCCKDRVGFDRNDTKPFLEVIISILAIMHAKIEDQVSVNIGFHQMFQR